MQQPMELSYNLINSYYNKNKTINYNYNKNNNIITKNNNNNHKTLLWVINLSKKQ